MIDERHRSSVETGAEAKFRGQILSLFLSPFSSLLGTKVVQKEPRVFHIIIYMGINLNFKDRET